LIFFNGGFVVSGGTMTAWSAVALMIVMLPVILLIITFGVVLIVAIKTCPKSDVTTIVKQSLLVLGRLVDRLPVVGARLSLTEQAQGTGGASTDGEHDGAGHTQADMEDPVVKWVRGRSRMRARSA